MPRRPSVAADPIEVVTDDGEVDVTVEVTDPSTSDGAAEEFVVSAEVEDDQA